MLRGVLIGLMVLVLIVFAYVGYSSYSTGKPNDDTYANGMVGGRAKTDVKAEPTGSTPAAATLPSTPATGDSPGLVAQGGGTAAASGINLPATDSIAPNPPNGMTFGGNGHFQLYRQGDITWRLNTDTGQTCIIFATDEEWRKPKVYQAGCRGR